MSLEDVGKTVRLNSLREQPEVKVIMAIKADRGECRIFEHKLVDEYSRQLGQTYTDTHCEAIKAFMEEHK